MSHGSSTLPRGLNPLRANSSLSAALRGHILQTRPDRVGQILIFGNEGEGAPGLLPVLEPGQARRTIESLYEGGIRHLKIFVKNSDRDAEASGAHNKAHFGIDLIKRIKDIRPEMVVHTETCLCPFTDTGACVIHTNSRRAVHPMTFERLAQLALNQASAGADVLGLASMANGSTRSVATALRDHRLENVALMPHLILTSALYGPFAQVTGIGRNRVRRSDLQLDPSRLDVAIRTALSMAAEGADMILLEPALTTVDLVQAIKTATGLPCGAFCVSGEAPIFSDSFQPGLSAEYATMLLRAGHDLVFTYFAEQVLGISRHSRPGSDVEEI